MTTNFKQNINTPPLGRSIAAAEILTQSDVGKVIICTGGPYTVTLPLATEAGVGGSVWFMAPTGGTQTITIDEDAGDTLTAAADVSNGMATTPSSLFAVSDGVLDWVLVGGAD